MPSNSVVKDSIVIGGLTILGYMTGGKLGSMLGAVIGTVVCSIFNGEQSMVAAASEPSPDISHRNTPYSRSTSNLKTRRRKINKSKDELTELSKCSICLESFKPSVYLWPCSHTCFCDDCCDKVKWKKVSSCPICREHICEFRSI